MAIIAAAVLASVLIYSGTNATFVAYGVAICCLLECCVFIFDIVRIWRGDYE
ncbi:MAG: hypothetical protein WCO26_21985 [Deltaproteobacteria bacterium]